MRGGTHALVIGPPLNGAHPGDGVRPRPGPSRQNEALRGDIPVVDRRNEESNWNEPPTSGSVSR